MVTLVNTLSSRNKYRGTGSILMLINGHLVSSQQHYMSSTNAQNYALPSMIRLIGWVLVDIGVKQLRHWLSLRISYIMMSDLRASPFKRN